MSAPGFERVIRAVDIDDLTSFLCGEHWPFHGTAHLSPDQVREMAFDDDATETHWITVDGEHVGLIRLFDLDDIDDGGSPLFDIRITGAARGRGIGRTAVAWLTEHLFAGYDGLHRIEATTRDDNVAMQRVLERCGYRREGRLRESWLTADGRHRHDTLVYGILRTDPR